MIEVENLLKKFGNFTALDKINFKADKGEIITLLGPNGAGKTTLMRCLCGYWLTDGGCIKWDGIDIKDNISALRLGLGYMPENTPLYAEMKVLEYLRFIAGVYRMPAPDFKRQLDWVSKNLDIRSVLKQKIATLSKGYRRRVGVAAVMLHRPQILILDEPTEGLDPNQKIVLRQLLKEYSSEALVIISTHLLEEAEALSSRVIILNHGQMLRDTTVQKLKQEAPDGDLGRLFYNLTNRSDCNVE